jgi:hypothetical protein
MKNLKVVITILFLSISLFGFSQKVKLKKGEVLVDDVVWMNYQECGSFDSTCSLLNKNKEEIIFFKFINLEGVEPSTPSNPRGTLNYVEVKFLGFNKGFEIRKTQKDIIQLLYNSKVLTESGELDQEKAAILVEKYGTEFSNRLNRTSNNNTTIIIKEDTPRNGVNINLGR